MGRVMTLDATYSIVVRLLNSYFTEEPIAPKGSVGLFYLDSEHLSDVIITNTTFSNIQTNGVGSCMSLKSGGANVLVVNSTFRNNHARCAGIFWMPVEESLVLVFQGCYFESNGADEPGGLASCKGKSVNITMLDSKINGSNVQGPGGVFDAGFNVCDSQGEIWRANVAFKNTVIEHCSCTGSGGVAAIDSIDGHITVQDSFFGNISAQGPGAVLWAGNTKTSSASLHIKISNTVFKNSTTQAPGGLISGGRVRKLFLDKVAIDSASAYIGPGGVLDIEGENDMEVNITNSTFKNCKAAAPGGILYLTADKPLTMAISDSVFESSVAPGPGGCMYLMLGQAYATFNNVTFRNCQSLSTPGGAVYIIARTSSEIVFHSSVFLDNTARASVGGALCIDLPQDIISDPGCIKHSIIDDPSTPHRSWNYSGEVQIIDTSFVNNTAQSGGALAFSRGQHVMQSCTFRDNFANLRGGHILSSSDSTSLLIYDSKFTQTRKTQVLNDDDKHMCVSFSIASFIDTDSRGPLILKNSSLESKSLGDVKPLVMVSQGGYVSFDNNTSLICPRGSDLEFLNFTNTVNTEFESNSCKIILSVFQFNCKACPVASYSLQHGRSAGLEKIDSFKCLSCPFGAECLLSIKAKANYWGYQVPRQNPPALTFTNCPAGYCEHPEQRDSLKYNSCRGNRSGILCGRCKEDYTETLLSPSCRRNNECDDTWLWGVAVVMLLLMAVYLVHKPRFSVFIRRQIFWFRKDNNDEEVPPEHGDVKVKSHDKGYLKIVFYFYQVANLLLISTSYNTIIESHLLQPVVGFFNFQFRFSSSGFLCPFRGLTVVTKELFMASQVFGLFIMILFCYFCHVLVRKCKSLPSPNLGPYLGAVLETMLLGYAVFANTALKLLQCTTIGEESRLFISGQVLCYQWWQYLLMVFVGVVIVHFVLILGLGSYWLRKGSISVKGFLLGCTLPLPYLVFRLARHLFFRQRQPSEESAEWKACIEDVLFGAFRLREGDSYGALYWESVLTGRRLIIIIIYVSFSDPLCKQLLLTFVCVAILIHHLTVLPFRNAKANNVEMASLLGLIVIAIINMFKASFLTTYGQDPQGPLLRCAQILDSIQMIILSVVPVICILLVIASVVSQLVRLCTVMGLFVCVGCCKRYFAQESRPLLEPTDFNESTVVQT
ncbi:uncharacterized protein LOC116300849 [Actinia tenebrosa]|uniref:Uncharacterized protein LOC116300849 n=1 Tax=Actinia tenebrosa TaxID=6105 RepID=A0A6P8IG60_ACTTE|nr:uncharacterized protein LOC116300849 [Actinia tenebrosa]